MSEERVRVFVSSPSDVEHERAAVKDIIDRLAREYLPYFQLQAILWEEEALTADRTFQAGLTRPQDCEIVLVILWTRLGSPLPEEPYRGMTGTEWEFISAVEASSGGRAPEVLVYKKTAPRLVDITDAAAASEAVEDRRRLDEFFQTHFFNEDNSFRRAFRTFDSDGAFRELVEVQLRKLLNRRISAERRAAAGALQWQGSPFRPDRPFDIGDERVFTGREGEIRELLRQLSERPPGEPGFVLMSGPSGAGKTSLLRAGLIPRLTRPFLFEHVSTVRCALVDPGAQGSGPLSALAACLTGNDVLGESLAGFGLDAIGVERLLATEPAVAARQLLSALALITKTSDNELQGRLAVIVDPLDNALETADSEQLRRFAEALSGLAWSTGIWVVAAVRSDRLHRLDELPALTSLLRAGRWMRLEPPAAARIRQVIEIPARIAGLDLESARDGGGLVEQIEAEASRLRLWAPPVQGVLEDAYRDVLESGGEVRLSAARLRADGGLAGQVLSRADALWDALDTDARAALPRVCRALIGIDGSGGPQLVPRRGDMHTLSADAATKRLLDALIDARLVIAEGLRDPSLEKPCEPGEERMLSLLRDSWRQTGGQWLPRGRRAAARRSASPDGTPNTSESASEAATGASAGPGAGDATVLETSRPADPVRTEAPPTIGDGETLDAAGAAGPSGDAARWRSYRPVASFSHPALIEVWSPVRDWLRRPGSRRSLELRARLTRQAKLWKRTDCNREYLYREAGYRAAQELVHGFGDELEPLEREFLERSSAHLAFLRRRSRFVRAVGVLLIGLLTAAVAAALVAQSASEQARTNLQRSQLKEADRHINRGNTPQAVKLAIGAGAYLPQQAVRTLGLAFSTNRLLAMAQSVGPSLDEPRTPAFNADGSRLATIVPGVGPRLWRLERGRFVADRDLQGDGLGLHSLVIGDEDRVFGIGMRGIWRLPASADSAPDYPCGGMPGARTTLDASRRYLAVAHGNRDEQGVCVVDLARPGRVPFRRAFDEGLMRGLSFSPDGKALLTASSIGRTHVIDLEEGAIRMSLPADGPLGRPFNNAVFDAAGERIAIAAVDERVRLYRTDGTPVDELAESPVGERSYRVHRTAVRDVAFAPDGAFLVAVDDAGQVVRWSLDGSRQAVVLGNHDLSVGSVAIEPAAAKTGASEPAAETLVLTGSLDRTARLWGLETGTAVAVLGHDGALSEARFSRDGTRVFSFSERDGTVRLWSVQPVSSLAFELRHPDHVWNLDMAAAPPDLAPDGEALLLATAGYDGGVRVWRYDRAVDAAAPEPLAVFREHSDRVRQVDLSPSGRRVASAGFDGASRVSDLLTNASCTVRIAKPNEGKVYNALFGSPPGSGAEWLLTTSDDADRPVRLFNPADCAPIATGDAFAHGGVEVQSAAVRMIADRTLVATGDGNGTLRLLEQDNGGRWHRRCEVRGGVGAIGSIGLSADGTLIGVAGEASRAAVIDYDGRQCAAPRFLTGHTGRVYSIDVSPDGRQLLTASLDKTARTWFRDGRPWAVLVGHEDRIYHAAYSPGTAEWMLTASRDGSVRLWRRPTSRDGVVQRDTADGPVPRLSAFLPLRADLGGVASAAFSPDGNYIAGAYWDNAAMLWRLWSETPEVPRERQRRWGKERARLALVEEAYRFRADNRVTDPDERQTDAANAP